LGLGVEVELLASLHHLVEGGGAHARVEGYAPAIGPFPLGVEVVEPHHVALVLFQLEMLTLIDWNVRVARRI